MPSLLDIKARIKAVENIKKKARFSVERILEIEEETKHDVIAFLTNLEVQHVPIHPR